MKEKIIVKYMLLALFCTTICQCTVQQTNNPMLIKKLDLRGSDKSYMKGDWLIETSGEDRSIDMYSPARLMREIQQWYHPNGMISRYLECTLGIPIYTKEFDESGLLTEEVNDEAQYGAIKPYHLADILEKEGWFNRKTGEIKGFEGPSKTNGHFTQVISRSYQIVFFDNIENYRKNSFSPSSGTSVTLYDLSKKNWDAQCPIWIIVIRGQVDCAAYGINGCTGEFMVEHYKEYRIE